MRNALTEKLCSMLDSIKDETLTDRQYTIRINKAKQEFARCRIATVDFHGFWDLYLTKKKEGSA